MQAAIRGVSTPILGVLPMAWSRYLATSSGVPNFLHAFTPRGAGAGAGKKGGAMPSVPGLSLETILDMAKRTAGGEVDSDVPLMDAGVDSLGAVELRNQLQRAAGNQVTVPSTIVFDYPTARALTSFLAPKSTGSKAARGTTPRFPLSRTTSRVDVCGASGAVPGGAATVDDAWEISATGMKRARASASRAMASLHAASGAARDRAKKEAWWISAGGGSI